MRRSRKEKELTHKRIVEIAARRFREKGFQGISVADIMGEAGLTHGGFYKHFESRDALIAEAISNAFIEESKDLKSGMQDSGASGIEAFLTTYLSERHLSDPGGACPVATLATEAARTPAAQPVFGEFFQRYASWLAKKMDGPEDNKTNRAAAVICAAAGAYAIARGLDNKKDAVALLNAMNDLLTTALEQNGDM